MTDKYKPTDHGELQTLLNEVRDWAEECYQHSKGGYWPDQFEQILLRLIEAEAEIARHHKDFVRISDALDTFSCTGHSATIESIRQIVG